jgi:drug/metabolite transporter (DMT)-like permease
MTALAPAAPSLKARAMVAALGLMWGLNWPAARMALRDLSPWTFRSLALWAGAAVLLGIAALRGRPLGIARPRDRLHLAIAGLLNLAGCTLFSSFGQLGTTTTRVAIIAYTMPVWVTFLARIVLGERLDAMRWVALTLGVAGLAVLVVPFLGGRIPIGMWFALGAALSWAAGTVYVKWAPVRADPFVIAGWQAADCSPSIRRPGSGRCTRRRSPDSSTTWCSAPRSPTWRGSRWSPGCPRRRRRSAC